MALVVGVVLLIACGSTNKHEEAPSRFSRSVAYVGTQIAFCLYSLGQFFRAVARLVVR